MKFILACAAIMALALTATYLLTMKVFAAEKPAHPLPAPSLEPRVIALPNGVPIAYEFRTTDGRICVVAARSPDRSMQCNSK